MKEAALVIIKPDGFSKKIIGEIISKFAEADLEIVAAKIARPTRSLAEQHYRHIKGMPFFEDTVSYFIGKFHKEQKLLTLIYFGKNAIKKCRKIAGATNPEDADPESIRGSFGRVTTKGVFENVVHVSSDKKEAKREIQLWFKPDDITSALYPTRKKTVRTHIERLWK